MSSSRKRRTRILIIALCVAVVQTLLSIMYVSQRQPTGMGDDHPPAIAPTYTAVVGTLQRQPKLVSPSGTKSKCSAPISLKVGQIDDQFNVGGETLRKALHSAASEWNSATGETLFVVRDDGSVAVNLLFDGRQDSINKLAAEERDVSAVSEDIKSRIKEHELAVTRIEANVAEWRRAMDSHNMRIDNFNERSKVGFDSPGLAAASQVERQEIEQATARLNESRQNLMLESDRITEEANRLNQEGADLTARIRSIKQRFPPNVFTEGEHRRGPTVNEINIYTFYDLKEFHVVLLHEMGHVLGLSHSDERSSIMFPVIEHDSDLSRLAPSDVQAALALCGE